MHFRKLAGRAALLLLPIALAACAGSDAGGDMLGSARDDAHQSPPADYRAQVLAFMKTYLRNPVDVHNAAVADPVERMVDGRLLYVSCLRFTPRESDGSYRDLRERGIVFVNGKLDRIVEKTGEICAGVTYAPFPDLEKMTR